MRLIKSVAARLRKIFSLIDAVFLLLLGIFLCRRRVNPLSISDFAGLSRIAIVGAAALTFSAFAVGHICYLYSAFHNFKSAITTNARNLMPAAR